MENKQREELKAWLSDIRREIHMNPEIAYKEVRTTGLIKKQLEKLGIPAVTFEKTTGVMGLIRNSDNGPTLALRADIDALPVQEKTGAPYESRIPGMMHACGHDSHAAIMLGVAKLISDHQLIGQIPGNLKIIFQPGEEGGAGAKALMEQGVLKDPDVDWIIAGHAFPDLPAGHAGFFKKQSHASANRFVLKIQGEGAHGARPNMGIDPIGAAAQFIQATHTIVSRFVDPLKPAVISVGKIQGGTASNVIPDQVTLEGTIRALEPEVRDGIFKKLRDACAGLEACHGVKCDLYISGGYPPAMGDEEVNQFLYDTAKEVLGEDNISWLPPSTGAEDFAYYTQKVKGGICRIGSGNPEKGITKPLHSPLFDIDEDMLVYGSGFFFGCVLKYFGLSVQAKS
jgi:amidohydrolase